MPARFFHLCRELVASFCRACAFFLRVTENAETLEFSFANESTKLVDVLLGLTGKPDDERSAKRNTWNAGADTFDQVTDVCRRRLALHLGEHVVADVLQRHIDIAGNFGALGDRLDQLIAP